MPITEEEALRAYDVLLDIGYGSSSNDSVVISDIVAALECYVQYCSEEFGILSAYGQGVAITIDAQNDSRECPDNDQKLKADYIRCIGNYKTLANAIAESNTQTNAINELAALGLSLADMIMSIKRNDMNLGSKFIKGVKAVHKSSKELKKSLSKCATDKKYQLLREFKDEAGSVARAEWENGSPLNHIKMRDWLMNDYKDENGKYPFISLPIKSKDGESLESNKVLLELTKDVAKAIGRPDLICGNKKNSK
jgi:hypothetical protein